MGDMTTPAVITEVIADVTTKVVDLDATLMTSSRAKFLLAAIGAAVGFGNMWRFPAIAHEYGGGIFFLPYILALVFIGLPLLVYEIATGQHLQKSTVAVSGHFSKHFRGVGLASIFCGFCVLCYYVPLISWCLRAFFVSFGNMRRNWDHIAGIRASSYFFQDVVGTATLDEDLLPSTLMFVNVFCLFLVWAIVGSCLAYGVKGTGRVTYVTLGLPTVMLFILFIRTFTLPGALSGISKYLFGWDWSVFVDQPDIWSTAVSQTFFSLGVGFGIMTALGARCEKDAPAFQNSLIIAGANSAFSFFSGFCIFAALGYLSRMEGELRVQAGSAFLFGAFPAAFSPLNAGLHWVRFFFLMFTLFGLNSAFIMVEALVMAIEDSAYCTLPKHQIIALVCSVGFVCGLIYTTDAALHFIDTVDFYVNFIVLLLGFCKAFSAGWMFDIQKQISILGYNLVYSYLVSTFGSVCLASLVWFGVAGNTVLLGFICLITVYGMGIFYCYYLLKCLQVPEEGHTVETLSNELVMGNILDLRADLESSVGGIPYVWAILMKHVVPQILLVLLFNLAFARTAGGQWEFGSYDDYPVWPFQVVGITCVVMVVLIVAVGLLQARLFDGFCADMTTVSESESFEMVKKDQETDYMDMAEMEKGGDYPATMEKEPPIIVLT